MQVFSFFKRLQFRQDYTVKIHIYASILRCPTEIKDIFINDVIDSRKLKKNLPSNNYIIIHFYILTNILFCQNAFVFFTIFIKGGSSLMIKKKKHIELRFFSRKTWQHNPLYISILKASYAKNVAFYNKRHTY